MNFCSSCANEATFKGLTKIIWVTYTNYFFGKWALVFWAVTEIFVLLSISDCI